MWKIRGQYGQYIELQFIELDVNIRSLVDSFVEVFDFDLRGERSASFGRFTKVTMPHIRLLSSWHMMDVEFRVGNSLTGRGFLGLYTIKDTVIETISNESGKIYKIFVRSLAQFFVHLYAFIFVSITFVLKLASTTHFMKVNKLIHVYLYKRVLDI